MSARSLLESALAFRCLVSTDELILLVTPPAILFVTPATNLSRSCGGILAILLCISLMIFAVALSSPRFFASSRRLTPSSRSCIAWNSASFSLLAGGARCGMLAGASSTSSSLSTIWSNLAYIGCGGAVRRFAKMRCVGVPWLGETCLYSRNIHRTHETVTSDSVE